MNFQLARREVAYIKLGIQGPAGSGKTYSALMLARGLCPVGKVLLIDTENGSGSLFAHLYPYYHHVIAPPFSPEKYISALKGAEEAGMDVVIVDSLSHEWAEEGGILDQKAALDARGGNQYANWKVPSENHKKFKAAILQSRCHVIGTMRAKAAYLQTTDERGRQKIERAGMQAIQRGDDMEYEFTVVFDLAQNHSAQAIKDRTGLFGESVRRITEDDGKAIREWLFAGDKASVAPALAVSEPAARIETYPDGPLPIAEVRQRVFSFGRTIGLPWFDQPKEYVAEIAGWVKGIVGLAPSHKLTESDWRAADTMLEYPRVVINTIIEAGNRHAEKLGDARPAEMDGWALQQAMACYRSDAAFDPGAVAKWDSDDWDACCDAYLKALERPLSPFRG